MSLTNVDFQFYFQDIPKMGAFCTKLLDLESENCIEIEANSLTFHGEVEEEHDLLNVIAEYAELITDTPPIFLFDGWDYSYIRIYDGKLQVCKGMPNGKWS